MAIKTTCPCGFSFNARDEFSGKRVKCPRCQAAVQVPDASQAVGASGGAKRAASAGAPQVNKKLLDLLDDAGVKSTPKGPICAACGEEMEPSAVICINCGYNVATGQYLDTYTDPDDEEGLADSKMTDAQKRLAKAEREIADSPIGAEDQDFGDGADSYVVAMAGLAIFAVVVLIGLAVVLIMDSVTDEIHPGFISAVASTSLYALCAVWITYVAFRTRPGQAIACVFSLGLFCPILGFMMGRGTIGAAAIMTVSLVVGGGSWMYCIANDLL